MVDTIRCGACGLDKSTSDFDRNRSKPGGRAGQCKDCRKAYNDRYQARLAIRRGPLPKEKVCNKCGKLKPESAFKKHTRAKDGLNWYCRKCVSHHNRLATYGLSEAAYHDMLTKQNGKCAVCGATEATSRTDHLFVDHDHKTGRVRGLLCHACNFAIGHTNDSPDILRSLASYLESRAS
jgi:hypothetical protein